MTKVTKQKQMQSHRVSVLGAGGVGKTALTKRFISGYFCDEAYHPRIADTYREKFVVDDEQIFLDVRDVYYCGDSEVLLDHMIIESEAYVFCVAADRYNVMKCLKRHHEKAIRLKECENSDLAMCIALNKCDLEYSPELLRESEDLAAEWGCELIKNSAKENINSKYIFEHIVRELRKPEGQRGTWPWNVGGLKQYYKLLLSIKSSLEKLQFPSVLIDEFFPFIVNACFMERVREYKPKKHRNCSIM